MKLSRTMKKMVALVCAIAMVVAGITYTPQEVSGADETITAPTGLTLAEGVVSWTSVENAVSYNVYVNSELKSTGADTTVNVAEYIATTGVHIIEVSAVTEKGTESDKALITAKVANAPEGYTLTDENAWTTVGKWQLYNGIWGEDINTSSQVARLSYKTTEKDEELDVNYTLVNQSAEYLIQCRYTFEGLQAGTYYTYEIKANDIVIKTETGAATGETMTVGDYDIAKFAQGTDVKLTATIKEYVAPEPPEFPDGKTLTDLVADSAYNIALNKGASVYPGCAEGSIDALTDGSFSTGHCALSSGWGYLDESYAIIDLGDYYDMSTIDMVAVTYKDTADNDTVITRSYSIGYSMDGTNYTDVVANRPIPSAADLDLLDDKATVDTVATEGTARFIRVYYPTTANYGIQITEIAVLDTDNNLAKAEVPTCDDAAGVTVKSDALGTITVNITAGDNQDGFTYTVYVDDSTTAALSNIQAGVDYDITGIESGEHTVKVVAMYNGAISAGIVSEPVTVITIMDYCTDPKINMALNKAYTLDSGTSTEGGDGSPTNGIISNGDYVTPTRGQAGSWMTVDLGKAYESGVIDQIYVWFRYNFGGCYPENGGFEVQYSSDGEDYITVSTVSQQELNEQRQAQATEYFGITPAAIDTSGIETVQYVRIYFPEAVAYGAQISEICILDLDGDGIEEETTTEEVSEPESETESEPVESETESEPVESETESETVESETESEEITTEAPTEAPATDIPATTASDTTTVTTTPQQTTAKATTATPKATTKALGKTKVKKATKKKAAKKVKITFKKVTGAKKYTVQISKTKKFKKILVKKTVKKVKVTITSKKLKNKKKLYVRVRAVGATKWSKVKKIKIKK